MKPRIYVETTVPSYLTAWPSRDLVRAAHQQITREWWERRDAYDVFISELVVRECEAGDPKAAAARLAAIAGLPLLGQGDEGEALARALLVRVPLPERATADALHIATAATHGMDYLLTWKLHPYRQCGPARPDRGGVPGRGVRAANDLHARRAALRGGRR